LAGTVVNAATGEPVSRALVQISSVRSLAMLTDSGGQFEFRHLPEMHAAVTVRKPGFFDPREVDGRMDARIVAVGDGNPPLVLRLVPEAIISARVVADGEPVAGLPVKVITLANQNGRRAYEGGAGGNTDEDGIVRIANLKPGRYYVVAGPKASSNGFQETGLPEVLYPGVTEPSEATVVELAPGQEAQLDFTLKSIQAFRVSGVVSGVPVESGVSLEFVNRLGERSSFPTRIDRTTGEFMIVVPAGSYILSAHAQAAGGGPLSADVPLAVSGDVKGIQLALSSMEKIPVVVNLETSGVSQPAQGAAGLLRSSNGPPVGVTLESSEVSLNRVSYMADPEVTGTRLSIRGVQPGNYTVELTPTPPWYVKSAAYGATDVLREDLKITGEGRRSPLEIVLRDDSGSVEGTVQSEGQPAFGTVLLVPDGAPRQARAVPADWNGHFLASCLAPGDYAVLAFDRIAGLSYAEGDTLSAYLSRAARISIPPAGKVDVNVPLIRLEK
jgi:hypothetical protein